MHVGWAEQREAQHQFSNKKILQNKNQTCKIKPLKLSRPFRVNVGLRCAQPNLARSIC
jgi:hypothetical protein